MKNKLTTWKQSGNIVLGKTTNGCFQLYAMDNGIVRLRYGFGGELFPEFSYQLLRTVNNDRTDVFLGSLRQKIEPAALQTSEEGSSLKLCTEELEILINREEFSALIRDKDGWELLSDIPELAYRVDRNGRRLHYARMPEKNSYYGFGEKTGSLDKLGMSFKIYNTDSWAYSAKSTDPLYVSIPFFIRLDNITHKACGLFYHNTNPAFLDISREICCYYSFFHSYSVDDGEIDLFVIPGPSIAEVLEKYTYLTGRTQMPPVYSLGNIASGMYFAETESRSDLEEIRYVERYRQYDIPCDFMYLSSGYFSDRDARRLAFQWNRDRFPNPGKFIEELSKRNIPVCPNIKPGFLTCHPDYRDLESLFIKDSTGNPATNKYWGGVASYLDFTSEAGREKWKNYIKDNLIKNGILDIWNDNCEFELEDFFAQCAGEGESVPHSTVRNVLPVIMAKLAKDALEEKAPEHRPYIVNRGGSAGIQQYAQVWSGDNLCDWETLRYSIPMMLGLGLSGVASNACDIGGFTGSIPDRELFIRWLQNGVFQPRLCIHCQKIDNTVTEPWMYEDILDTVKNTLWFRYRFLLYLYTLFHESSKTGAPIMRPMIYEFQKDAQLARTNFDFMFGPWILVANVVEKGARKRDVYLPEGIWYFFEDYTPIEGGRVVTVDAPLDKIPMFIRQGAIIPLVKPKSPISMDEIGQLEILADLSTQSHWDIYFDDGVTNNFKNGKYSIIRVETCQNAVTISQKGDYQVPFKSILLHLIIPEAVPKAVFCGSFTLDRVFERSELEDTIRERCWLYDNSRHCIVVKVPYSFSGVQISLRLTKHRMLLVYNEY